MRSTNAAASNEPDERYMANASFSPDLNKVLERRFPGISKTSKKRGKRRTCQPPPGPASGGRPAEPTPGRHPQPRDGWWPRGRGIESYWVSPGHPLALPPLRRFRSSPDLIRLSRAVCRALACQESLNRDRLERLRGGKGGAFGPPPPHPRHGIAIRDIRRFDSN